jgi:hypothetical protein
MKPADAHLAIAPSCSDEPSHLLYLGPVYTDPKMER